MSDFLLGKVGTFWQGSPNGLYPHKLDGSQNLDRRHVVNLTAVAQSPRFANRALRMIGSDWILSSSYRRLSAASLTATNGAGVDPALSGAAGQRPNQILPDPLCANPRPACWINPAAFAIPPSATAGGTLGNSGRSSIPGPGSWEIDSALSRIFRIVEGKSLEVRGEAFNLTNSFRAATSGPVATRNSPQFGQILTAQDPRIMQVAAKFVF